MSPYSKDYDRAEIRKDFPAFRIDKSYKRWMHGPPFPVSWLPFGQTNGLASLGPPEAAHGTCLETSAACGG